MKNKGITLVSLVVTIIILIILAGVSLNLTIGKNGIITIAQKAKENIEFAQIEEQSKLNELYTQLQVNQEVGGELNYDAIAKLNNFKKSIADYIQEAGGIKPEYTANVENFGESIKGIVAEVTKLDSYVAVTPDNLPEGKMAWVNGELITGNGKDALNRTGYTRIYSGNLYSNAINSGTSVTITLPKEVQKGILIVNLYSYNGSNQSAFTINITDASGIVESTQLLDRYNGGKGQSAVTSIWNCTFNPQNTITVFCRNTGYSLSNITYMILY